jgi:hypothetical protein
MLLDGTGGKTSPPPGLRTGMFAAPERPTPQQPSLAAEGLGIAGKDLHHSAGAVFWRSHVAEVIFLTKNNMGQRDRREALLQKSYVPSSNNRPMSPKGPGLCENHYRPLAEGWQTHARLSITHTKIKYFLDSSVVSD